MRIPILSGPYKSISSNISSQELINFYLEQAPPQEMHKVSALPVHGSEVFNTLGSRAFRAMLFDHADELLYHVSGNTLQSHTSGKVVTFIDTLATSSGRVEMALNPQSREIVTVDGSGGYHYDIDDTTASDISDEDFPEATTVAYINGRFLVNDPDFSGRFMWSDINDGTAWDTLSFATAETLNTPIQKILVHRSDIFLFGLDRTELWFNSGDPDFVFQKFESLDIGIVSGATACLFDNSVAWLAQSERGQLQVVRAGEAYQPEVISNPQLSYKWEQYSTVSDAFAYTYIFQGHEFYVITFPTANATFAFDALTKEWHQRSGPFSSGEPTREIYNTHVYTTWSGGTHLFGDYRTNGKIHQASESVYTIDSTNVERRVTGPTLYKENEARLRFTEVQVDIEEGVIQSSDTGASRELTLAWSKDGGKTFTETDLEIGEGSTNYNHRLIRRKLGQARTWTFRIYSSTPRKLVIKGAYGRIYGEPFDGFKTSN